MENFQQALKKIAESEGEGTSVSVTKACSERVDEMRSSPSEPNTRETSGVNRSLPTPGLTPSPSSMSDSSPEDPEWDDALFSSS